jgi:hypothetical protein
MAMLVIEDPSMLKVASGIEEAGLYGYDGYNRQRSAG